MTHLVIPFLSLFRNRKLDNARQRMRDLANFAQVCAEIEKDMLDE